MRPKSHQIFSNSHVKLQKAFRFWVSKALCQWLLREFIYGFSCFKNLSQISVGIAVFNGLTEVTFEFLYICKGIVWIFLPRAQRSVKIKCKTYKANYSSCLSIISCFARCYPPPDATKCQHFISRERLLPILAQIITNKYLRISISFIFSPIFSYLDNKW